MSLNEHLSQDEARRVVAGQGSDGLSKIVEDGPTRPWTRRPNGTVVRDLWRVENLPASPTEGSAADDEVVLAPPKAGVVIRTTVFPPENAISEADRAAYEEALSDIYGEQQSGSDAPSVPGMHATDTIDVMTVVDGEIWAVMEDGETCLRQGDTIVQRGTRHAWQNRSDHPVTVVTTMLPAAGDGGE
ncbi:cupin domain-containing protein [Corynebacterium sp. AOP40-9SA-29]|uniref:cupin domain-containing protein n=1 Tax=Corynebacterium sp. AOP40-9SA-29 TaxID=3457677 RepID=UPI004034CC40